MNRNIRNTYSGQTIRIDGNYYEDCIFLNCRLEYGATDEVGFVSCEFRDSVWSFVGNAASTVNFMTGLYHGMGENGRDLIEKTFDQIRAGGVSGPIQ